MKRFEHGYALLIGVNDYKVKRWALPGVSKDIKELKNVLVAPELCAYEEDNIKLIEGIDATRQGILDGLKWLSDKLESDPSENATAIIYYSGHGFREVDSGTPAYYFVPYNVKESAIASSALKASEFSGMVSSMNPRRLLVLLDCCHAGGMEVKDLGGITIKYTASAIPPGQFLEKEQFKSTLKQVELEANILAQGFGRAILSSSTDIQKSYMRRDKRMSLFTYHLIEALTGQASPQGGAKEVLVSDAMSYVHRRVQESADKEWGEKQTPGFNVNGNFPISLISGNSQFGKKSSASKPSETYHSIDSPQKNGDKISTGATGDNGKTFNKQGGVTHGDETTIFANTVILGNNSQLSTEKSIEHGFNPKQLKDSRTIEKADSDNRRTNNNLFHNNPLLKIIKNIYWILNLAILTPPVVCRIFNINREHLKGIIIKELYLFWGITVVVFLFLLFSTYFQSTENIEESDSNLTPSPLFNHPRGEKTEKVFRIVSQIILIILFFPVVLESHFYFQEMYERYYLFKGLVLFISITSIIFFRVKPDKSIGSNLKEGTKILSIAVLSFHFIFLNFIDSKTHKFPEWINYYFNWDLIKSDESELTAPEESVRTNNTQGPKKPGTIKPGVPGKSEEEKPAEQSPKVPPPEEISQEATGNTYYEACETARDKIDAKLNKIMKKCGGTHKYDSRCIRLKDGPEGVVSVKLIINFVPKKEVI